MRSLPYIGIVAVFVLMSGVIVGQRCSYEKALTEAQETSLKAGAELEEATAALGRERDARAQAEARAAREAAKAKAAKEVQHEVESRDLADYLNAHTAQSR